MRAIITGGNKILADRVGLLAARITMLAAIGTLLINACMLAPKPIHRVALLDTGTAYSVYVQGDYAFVATNEGVAVIDIHERDRPRQAALIELREAAFDVYVQGDLVYIAGPADGLVIANVADKERPQIAGVYPLGGVNEICVYNHIAYAATQQGELAIINVGDPANPSLLESYSGQGGMSLMVACLEDVVYFSNSDKGLLVLDVSEPGSPVKTTTVSRTNGTKDTQVVGDLLYLACHSNGVRILDIADPLNPKIIASFNDGGEAWGIGGDADVLWIGDLQEGVELYDMSDASSPSLIGQEKGYAPHDVYFDGEYAYLADQDRGFVILEYIGE